MKKKETKSRKTDKRTSLNNTDLGDLGLEPPKIYREPQKKIIQQNDIKKNKSKDNLSRNERRKLETKKRTKKNKLRKVLIWFLLILLLAGASIVLSLTVFFPIEQVTVKGAERYTQDEVLAQCTIDKGENLFLADTDTAKKMLEQNLPYIYTAEIHRKLPSTVEITVTESQPSYHIQNKDKTYILLDDNLKVLEASAKEKGGITVKKAEIKNAVPGQTIEFADGDAGDCLAQMAQVIKENSLTEITAIYSNNLSDNYVVYENRIDFKLGTCDNLEGKIYQGLAACEELNKSNPNAKGTMTLSGGKQVYFTEK